MSALEAEEFAFEFGLALGLAWLFPELPAFGLALLFPELPAFELALLFPELPAFELAVRTVWRFEE